LKDEEMSNRLWDPINTVNLYSPKVAEEFLRNKVALHSTRNRSGRQGFSNFKNINMKSGRPSGHLPKIAEQNSKNLESGQ
jgi:hypothetical protein